MRIRALASTSAIATASGNLNRRTELFNVFVCICLIPSRKFRTSTPQSNASTARTPHAMRAANQLHPEYGLAQVTKQAIFCQILVSWPTPRTIAIVSDLYASYRWICGGCRWLCAAKGYQG